MTSVIAAYKSDGTCIGRCDAKCHDAKEPKCTCICGGRNHGAGYAKALANNELYMEEYEQRNKARLVLEEPQEQLSIF